MRGSVSSRKFRAVRRMGVSALVLTRASRLIHGTVKFTRRAIVTRGKVLRTINTKSCRRHRRVRRRSFFFRLVGQIRHGRRAIFIVKSATRRIRGAYTFLSRRFKGYRVLKTRTFRGYRKKASTVIGRVGTLAPSVVLDILPDPSRRRFLVRGYRGLSTKL